MFKTKIYVDDTLNKFKIKLRIREFSQMYNIDYTNIFVSTIKFDTLRLFRVILMLKNLKYYQMNVNNAFIESFLKKVIYMRKKSSLDVKLFSDGGFLIHRNLYDLKQSVRN